MRRGRRRRSRRRPSINNNPILGYGEQEPHLRIWGILIHCGSPHMCIYSHGPVRRGWLGARSFEYKRVSVLTAWT
eukprot:497616-Pyramimonas_sp.AAC.1